MKRNKFDSDSVFASKHLKVKIKSYNIKITITFHIKAPKEEIKCVCPAAIVIDSVFKSGKNYQTQIFIKECNDKIKEKEIKSFIADHLGSSSDDDSEEEENLC